MRGKSQKSLANLKPAKKGEVRNPTGINRKRPFSDRYFAIAEEIMPEKLRKAFNKEAGSELLKPGATWGDADAYGQFLQAAKGNVNAAREVADRVEGKPPQRLEITGPEHKIVTLVVKFEKRVRGQWKNAGES